MASTSKSRAQRHSCEYCQKEFSFKSSLNRHRKIHLIKKDFKCSFCEYTTNLKTSLFLHIRTHTKERPYKCQWSKCNAAFSQPTNRDQHQKLVHKKDDETLKKFQCPTCSYKTGHKSNLTQHLKTHSDVKEFSCDLCPYRAKQKGSIKNHHASVHLKLKPFKCQHPNCESAFSQKHDLKQHQLVHNKQDESLLKFECSECDYKTGYQQCLKQHSIVHSEVKSFSCNLCSFRSKRQECVKQHFKNVHSNLKPYKCPQAICNYFCKTKSDLAKHVKVHEEFKEFSCAFPPCLFKTKHKSSLKTHEMTHQNEKPFQCKFCSFRSTQNCNLYTHIRRLHTGEAPFHCPSCPYRGKCSGDLKTHMKRRHLREKLSPEASSN